VTNLVDVRAILEASGFPVAYHSFVESQNSPLPKPPFIVYLVTNSPNFKADNKVLKRIDNIQIELYTDRKDLDAEAKVELALDEADLPYDSTESFIEAEQLFQKIYEVRLI
jgi:hypothetical protein